MRKSDADIKIEQELYNPLPNLEHIKFEKVVSGLYSYKGFMIQKVDKSLRVNKFRPYDYDWKIYKNNKYIITTSTLDKAKHYFNSIVKK